MEHGCSEIGNMFGGYDCYCGEPWLTDGCIYVRLKKASESPTVTKTRRRKMSQVAHDLMGRKNSTIKSDKQKGTRAEKKRKALKEQNEN